MRPTDPPQIYPDKIVTSAGTVVKLSSIAGYSVYRDTRQLTNRVLFFTGLGLFASFIPACALPSPLGLLLAIWAVVGIIAVGAASVAMSPVWRVEVSTPSGPVIVFESRTETPARQVAAAIYDALFPSSGPR